MAELKPSLTPRCWDRSIMHLSDEKGNPLVLCPPAHLSGIAPLPSGFGAQSMRVTFLGTGTSQGVPMIGCRCEVCMSTDPRDKRLRVSVLIEVKGLRILIDAGPDLRQQLLRADVRDLDAVLLTHEHMDHISGMDDLRAISYAHEPP